MNFPQANAVEVRAVWDWCYGKLNPSLNSEMLCETWWQTITRRYGEPHRHYHTLNHIDSMLQLWNENWNLLDAPHLVALGIFFHDVIYDVKASDNEEKSAEMFVHFGKDLGFETKSAENIKEWIIMTKAHSTVAHTSEEIFGSEDHHYLLDMDMAVLGRNPEDYNVYARNIRSEYEHIPLPEYCEKRAKVLQTFLQTANIFATKKFRELFEARARQNLEREIEVLLQGHLL